MTTKAIREKLHNYLEVADDKKVEALYNILSEAVEESSVTYSQALKDKLDERHDNYLNGSASTVTAAESKQRIAAILKGK